MEDKVFEIFFFCYFVLLFLFREESLDILQNISSIEGDNKEPILSNDRNYRFDQRNDELSNKDREILSIESEIINWKNWNLVLVMIKKVFRY